YSFHRYASVDSIKATMDNADPYSRCTPDGQHCLGAYWLTEFGYSDTTQRCWVCGWGSLPNTVGPGDAAVDIFKHCLSNQTYCTKAFYYDLIDPHSPPTGTPSDPCDCDTALLNSVDGSSGTPGAARGRFTTISNYLLAHP